MQQFAAFFEMGGYAGFVWPAYLVTLAVMAAVLIASLRAARSRERELETLRGLRAARSGAKTETPAP